MDKIIALLPIEQKKKTVVMFCNDARLINLSGLLSCFDTIGEKVFLKTDTNIDELCKRYLCVMYTYIFSSYMLLQLCFVQVN